MEQPTSSQVKAAGVVNAVHGFRYQVKDVARAVAFYTRRLGFTVRHQQLPAFASVSLGDADVLLSGPGASGSRPMPNGEPQTPGGWNRVVLKVVDLPASIAALARRPRSVPRATASRSRSPEDTCGMPL